MLIVDPQQRSVDWLALQGGGYRKVGRSTVIDLGQRELKDQLDWPEIDNDG